MADPNFSDDLGYDLLPVDHQPQFTDLPIPKVGQTIPQPNIAQDIAALPPKVANFAGDVTGVNGRADGGPASDPYADFRPSTNVEDARGESVPEKLYDNFMMNVTGQKDNWISDISNTIQGKPPVSKRESSAGRADGGRVLPEGLSAEYTGVPLNRWGIFDRDGALLATGKTRDAAIEALAPHRGHGGRVDRRNIDHAPTEAQIKANNYAHDRIHALGLRISIENARGSWRHGKDKNGKDWHVQMKYPYGYILGTEARDSDHVDCLIGPHKKAPHIFVVDQVDAATKKYDEAKCLLFFGSKQQAVNAYKSGFSDGKGAARIGHVTTMTVAEFKDWLRNYDTTKPLGRIN